MKERIYSIADAAKILRVSERRVRKFCEEGRLGRKMGGTWVISSTSLAEFRQKPRVSGNPQFLTDRNPAKLGQAGRPRARRGR